MGACFSQDASADTAEAKLSKGLDKRIKDDEKRMAKEVKLLLLGGLGGEQPMQGVPCCADNAVTPSRRRRERQVDDSQGAIGGPVCQSPSLR